MKKKKPKIKIQSVKKLKGKAWYWFSLYIRNRDRWQCVTCGKIGKGAQIHAGHFIPGRHNVILFDERGVHAQCYQCNVPLKGNPRAYDKFMRERYGEEVIKELEQLDRQTKQYTTAELLDLIDVYKKKAQEI